MTLYRRLGDIPGVDYETPTWLDRTTIPGHDMQPTKLPGGTEEYWEYEPEVWTGSPPAANFDLGWDEDIPTSERLRRLYMALELAGTPSTYHFLIQGFIALLWKARMEDPTFLDAMERFCWIDITLIRAEPDAASDEDHRYYAIATLKYLISLYEEEGYLKRALEVARIATDEFNQLVPYRERLEARLEALNAEEAGEDGD